MKTVGLVVWDESGEKISKHVAWKINSESLGLRRDDYIDKFLKPAMEALERDVGDTLFPTLFLYPHTMIINNEMNWVVKNNDKKVAEFEDYDDAHLFYHMKKVLEPVGHWQLRKI